MTTILCIEDEASIRANIVEEFEDAGYDVIESSNGESGLAAAIAHKPDLVLCDISMPKMNGLELLSVFRKIDSGLEDIPFIFLSALSDRESMIKGLNNGADDYLTKPVDFDLLLAKVKASLRQINRMFDKKQDEHVRLFKALSKAPLEKPDALESVIPLTDPSLSVVLVGKRDPSLTMIQEMLEIRGNVVRFYPSGKDFLVDANEIEPDIIVMSLYSDDMQAPIAASLAKRKTAEKEIPYVLIWPEEMKNLPNPEKLRSFKHVLKFPCSDSDAMEFFEVLAAGNDEQNRE